MHGTGNGSDIISRSIIRTLISQKHKNAAFYKNLQNVFGAYVLKEYGILNLSSSPKSDKNMNRRL